MKKLTDLISPFELADFLQITTRCEASKVLSQLKTKHIKLVDASYLKLPTFGNRDAMEEFRFLRIPGAVFYDLDQHSSHDSQFPHMLPSKAEFSKSLQAIFNDYDPSRDHVVIYDSVGIFSSPRLWWTFKVFGINSVSVLNGGLPMWHNLNMPVVVNDPVSTDPTNNNSPTVKLDQFHSDLVRSYEDVNEIAASLERFPNSNREKDIPPQLVDARPSGRFCGREPEPRDIPSGNIPGSINIPFMDLLQIHSYQRRDLGTTTPSPPDNATHCPTKDYFTYKKPEDLNDIFNQKLDKSRSIVTSCGSGISAAVLFLALHLTGVPLERLSLYDGSWTEWKTRNMSKS